MATESKEEKKQGKKDGAPQTQRVNHPPNLIFYAQSNEVNRIDTKDDYDYVMLDDRMIKKQSMEGFDDQYNNIIDYIVKITRQIWKEKDIGLIYDTYSTGVTIHKGLVNSHGINEVISGTLQTLQAFPDRKGLGWSVVWSGNDRDGYFTSHRGRSVATNAGDSLYGPATGKKVMWRTTADCLIHGNKIYEEWLVMDTYHLLVQLGLDPHEFAKKIAKSTKTLTPTTRYGLPETAETGLPPKLYVPSSSSFEIGEFILELMNKIWERRSINYVKEFYKPHAVVHYVCNRDLVGYSEIQGMFISLFASVPNAKVVLERITCNQLDSDEEWDVAVRWRIQGMHEGTGYFGAPSGKPIEIAGMNHYQVRGAKVSEEWMLFDGLDVLRQMYTESDGEVEQDAGDANFTGVS